MSNISFNPLAWAIKPLYDKAIKEDALFAKEVQEKESRKEKPKSLDECADYILGEAYDWASKHRDGKVGYAGLPDDEMVNLIKHYYDEENITIKKVSGASAQVAKTPSTDKKAEPKKAKVVKMDIPKETMTAGLAKMERPTSERQAKSESKKQANHVQVMDMFAGMWGDEEESKKQAEEIEEEEVEEQEEEMMEEEDDLPM